MFLPLFINVGIIGDIVQSAKHQQDALRTAIKMQTLYGQSIAVGNLGMLAMMKQDFATAHTCFEQVSQV
jgi:Flp pilus assembly protein TadD